MMLSGKLAGTLAMVALAISGRLALAQAEDAGTAVDTTKEITVEAPRSFPSKVERSPYTGASIVTTTVRIPVLYGDLDLSKPHDAERLMTRVERVAQSACQQLDVLYPLDPDPDCVSKAMASGRSAAAAAISQAGAAKDAAEEMSGKE